MNNSAIFQLMIRAKNICSVKKATQFDAQKSHKFLTLFLPINSTFSCFIYFIWQNRIIECKSINCQSTTDIKYHQLSGTIYQDFDHFLRQIFAFCLFNALLHSWPIFTFGECTPWIWIHNWKHWSSSRGKKGIVYGFLTNLCEKQ